MNVWKLSTAIFLIASMLFASAFISAQGAVKLSPSELQSLQKKLNALEEKNALLSSELYNLNLSLEYYKKQTEFYRKRASELGGGNKSAAGITGSAKLDAVAVREKVEQIGEFPFVERRVSYEGVTFQLSVEIRSGEGRVLVVTKPLMGVVFQDAANTAVLVAQKYTGIDLSGSDVIFSIVSDHEISGIDGPSAGVVMTLITISAIEGKALPREVTMTGAIRDDGSIGEVGGVVEKSRAAKAANKSLILIPRANAELVQYVEKKTQIAQGFYMIERSPRLIDAKSYIESSVGIMVEYVDKIGDVLNYV